MAVLSWNEIRSRAVQFAREWKDETRERAEKDTFWNQFFNVFGVGRRRVATFEEPVKKLNDRYGFIDLFWKGKLLVEHKSRGQNLDKAYSQALDYFVGLKEHELPQYVLVSDFHQFKLYDLDEGIDYSFKIDELPDHVELFGFIAGWKKKTIRDEDPVNIEAAELMGQLHDKLESVGYTGHDLEVYLVRLLFCLFADDTGIFQRGIFEDYIRNKTKEDGSDLAYHIAEIFQVLDTPQSNRLSNLDESIDSFPYVNGDLFTETVRIASFDSEMRDMLLEICIMDWGEISPAIFGSMFQAAMNPKERRNLGAHFTSEKNILKVIQPLFLDELHSRLRRAKRSPSKLNELHDEIAALKFFDPACGSGNFLIITYRELRKLELEILQRQRKDGQMLLNIDDLLKVSINQFYGIEIDEFAAKVAEVGMWLVEHQMNELVSLEFGQNIINLPLSDSAKISNGNSLRTDWTTIIQPIHLNYIIGNPPFYGKQYQSVVQKEDMKLTFNGVKGTGVLDYVSAWYLKAAQYIQDTNIEVAYVSTNSITQGEQTGVLWNLLFNVYSVNINFAHRTFQWNNKAKGKAAVHCVIIGFSQSNNSMKMLFDYDDIKGEPLATRVSNINGYLVEASNVAVLSRTKPISPVPPIVFGSMPNDGGFLLLNDDEKIELLQAEPSAVNWIRKFQGSREFINNINRWCLWLKDINPQDLRQMPQVLQRVQSVKDYRNASTREATKKLALYPSQFAEIRQPDTNYLVIPKVSSERRTYIPIGFTDPQIITSDLCLMVPNAEIFHFGILTSIMNMTWVRHVAGKMKSDFRYSNKLVYNNFPWPQQPSVKQVQQVEKCAQEVLKVRSEFPDSSLADLYNPLTMPPALVKAHQAVDKAVDICYRPQPFANERGRIEFLLQLFETYIQPLTSSKKKR